MSATVAAALKKIAVAIVSDKDARKTLFTILLVVLLVTLMPIFAIIALFSGHIIFDTNELVAAVEEIMTEEDIAMLTTIENTMESIEAAMENAEMPEKVTEAQALYIMALYGQSSQPEFVSRLVSCFQEGQTDAQLIERVNSEFGTDISVDEFTKVAQIVRPTETEPDEEWAETEPSAHPLRQQHENHTELGHPGSTQDERGENT